MTREEGLKRLRQAREKNDAEREVLRRKGALLQSVSLSLSMGSVTPEAAMEQAGLPVEACAGAQKEKVA